jgi:hypothetical protein
VESADGGLRFLRLGHGDEGEPARAAGDAIGDEVDIFHDAMGGEQILQGEFCRIEGKIPDEEFIVHDDSLLD